MKIRRVTASLFLILGLGGIAGGIAGTAGGGHLADSSCGTGCTFYHG
jgi:hypothetical protein